MASNDDLAPSSLNLFPPLPPSLPSSSLPSQTPSTTSSSPPSRPIPIEIYNHILHFAFGRHLPPVPLEHRLDEPPSLSNLLPLTLVSKGFRDLVLPHLYYHITIRREEDWIQFLDPTEGLLVGEGEEETRRRGWVKKLSFPRDHFPVSSWTASKDQPAPRQPAKRHSPYPPEPNMFPLDFSGLGHLEELCIGRWGRVDLVRREVEGAVDVELAGGPYRREIAQILPLPIEESVRGRIRFNLNRARSIRQTSSITNLLSRAEPSLLQLFLDPISTQHPFTTNFESLSLVLHPPRFNKSVTVEERAEELAFRMVDFDNMFPSSKFNIDLILDWFAEDGRPLFIQMMGEDDWVKDEAGWWTQEG